MKKYACLLAFAVWGLTAVGQAAGPAVYLNEARNNPFERNMFIDDTGETFRYTAFYKGASQPGEDIRLRFYVDPGKVREYNAANGTDYKPLPTGSYTLTLSTAAIPEGAVSAVPGEVRVIGKGRFKPFENYLLPVSVEAADGGVSADGELSTVYYVIHAVPAPGSIARKQIGRIPSEARAVFGLGGKYLIAVGADGRLTGYRYSGGSLGKGAPLAGSENLAEMDAVFNFRDRKLVGLCRKAGDGQLWSFPLGADGRSVGAVETVFGTSGYNIFSDIIPHGNTLYCLKPDGELMLYPLTDMMEWGSGIRSLGSGWNYSVVFGYKDSLIAVDNAGDMWKYPLLADGQTGLPRKIGSGWDRFPRIVVFGDDLLCIDKEGAVWRIRFGDQGFWAL